MSHRLTGLDVFTDAPLTGNGLAVVHGADDLDDATMLAFARETRLSETTFVQAPSQDGATYRNRIFWMKGEMDFAGHPSLGTAVAIARERGETSASYVQQTPAGLQPVDVELERDGVRAFATMLQEPAVFGDEVDPAEALAAVGIEPSAAHPELPPQIVSTGIAHLVVPVRDRAVLEQPRPVLHLVERLLELTGCGVLYLAAVEPEQGTARARGFFNDPGAVTEDPATGSAAGPLCAYLARRTGTTAVVIEQGVEMGRPSRLNCELAGDRVRVGGDVVVVSDGQLLF